MTGPSSSPRGERAPTRHETELVTAPGEHYDEDPAALADAAVLPPPTPGNRATRRAAARAARRKP